MDNLVKILVTFCFLVVTQNALFAVDAAPQVDDVFKSAELISKRAAKHPANGELKMKSGVVKVTFMVNKKGKVFESGIVDSTDEQFHQAALSAVKRYKYKPATNNGKVVISRQNAYVYFEGRDTRANADGLRFTQTEPTRLTNVVTSRPISASKSLSYNRKAAATIRKNSKSRKAVNDGHRELQEHISAIEKELEKGKPDQNSIRTKLDVLFKSDLLGFVGQSILYFQEIRYAERFSSHDEQLYWANKLALLEDKARSKADDNDEKEGEEIIEDSLIEFAKNKVIEISLLTGRYAEALNHYNTDVKARPEISKIFGPSINELNTMLGQRRPFVRPVRLHDSGQEFVDLIKPSFSIDVIDGRIDELKLRCDSNFYALSFKVDDSYQVPKSWGVCSVQIIGAKNTTAKMTQI